MDLSIIIVSWNVSELLQKCLKSIYEETQGLSFEIFVIDNKSNDDTVLMINKEFPAVNLIINNENLGFAVANNQGLELANGKYVLFMNPDMEIRENSFKKLVEFMDNSSYADASTCTLKYPDMSLQRTVKNFPGFGDQVLILLKLHHLIKSRALKKYLAKDFDYTKEQSVNQIMGAFMLFRKEVIVKLGGFSADYPIWWEDVDLCYRARKNGIKIIYTPITSVIHHEGKSFVQQPSLHKQKRFIAGMLVFFKKYKPLYQYMILIILSPVSLFLAWLVQILNIKPRQQSKL